MPKVSIVMPVYNGEKYLKEAIDSVISQTFMDWELILVNDCSSDQSFEIMQSYNDDRIKIINNNTNQKLPRSLNIGFANATGEYFTWTSDDNIYGKDAISKMVKFLDENKQYGLVYCSMYFIDSSNKIIGIYNEGVDKLYRNNSVGACFMYRRSVAMDIGNYDADMCLVEDYDYWLRINHKYDIFHLETIEYYYRKHENSLTDTQSAQINKQMYNLRIKELDFLLSKIDTKEKIFLFIEMYYQNKTEVDFFKCKFFNNQIPQELCWIMNTHTIDNNKKIILFGAGTIGRKALKFFGNDRVLYFADNNPDIVGSIIEGKEVISIDKLKEIYVDNQIIVSVNSRKICDIVNQFESIGIIEYVPYLEIYNNISV